jgi:threonine dehydrogenase-like Zn-dependent dehydrogenase
MILSGSGRPPRIRRARGGAVQALVYRGPFETVVEDVADPVADQAHVVVEVAAVGLCGSDVTAYKGHMDTAKVGDVRGHEFAGRVVGAVGPAEEWLGRTVAVNPTVTCGSCRFCRSGADNLCRDVQIIGVHRPGAYAELVRVPVGQLVAWPDDAPLTTAATAEALAQAVHDVHLGLRDGPVETALVIGAGAIGFFVLQAARNLGVASVAVLEPDDARRAAAAADGAARVYASVDEARELTGSRQVDVVFDCVGTEATRQLSLACTRNGGTVVLVGLHADESILAFRDVIRREVTLRGSMAETAEDFRTAVSWLAEGRAGLPGLEAPFSLAEGPRVFHEVATAGRPELRTFLAGRG